MNFIYEKLPHFFHKMFPKFLDFKTRKLIELKKAIEDYVKNNTSQLLTQLGEVVVSREDSYSSREKSRQLFKKIIKEKPTFVLIAGQASQFRPIRASIERELATLNIPVAHIHFLEGDEAKEACSKGAVAFIESCDQCINQKEIHGTLGFLNASRKAEDDFLLVNMKRFNSGEMDPVKFKNKSTYWLFYSPRAQHAITRENPPAFFNGTTALIEPFRGNFFEVEYNLKDLMIKVDGNSQFKVTTYGGVIEPIYPKVWPVVLPEIKPGN